MSYIDKFEEGYKYRIGNIELRKSKSLRDVYYMEVVQYYPNEYYGREEEFIYDKEGHYYYSNGHPWWHISPNCFKYPESCMTICTFKVNEDEELDTISVGSRPFNLNEKDWVDYKKVVEFFYQMYYHNDED